MYPQKSCFLKTKYEIQILPNIVLMYNCLLNAKPVFILKIKAYSYMT